MRACTILLVATAIASMPLCSPSAAGQTLRLATGASTVITLNENVTTGYTWRVDEAASQGVGKVVAVVDGGHAQPPNPPGAPPKVGAAGTRRYTIKAIGEGDATVVFAYQRAWERAPAESRRYTISVSAFP